VSEGTGREIGEVSRLRSGDGAGEAFVDRHYRGVYRFFAWLTHDPDAAADLTQETFAGFWSWLGRGEIGPAVDPKTWLYGIARNRWRKRCRDYRPCTPLEELDEGSEVELGEPGPEVEVLAGMEAEAVLRAVAELPPDYREALVLRVIEGLSYPEIAAVLHVKEGLARWRVHRARLRLTAMLALETKEECGCA
jgi:RNA polymerase sigma-70 factor (ECF subfamily)